jgi:hypothetical protein
MQWTVAHLPGAGEPGFNSWCRFAVRLICRAWSPDGRCEHSIDASVAVTPRVAITTVACW